MLYNELSNVNKDLSSAKQDSGQTIFYDSPAIRGNDIFDTNTWVKEAQLPLPPQKKNDFPVLV